MKVKKLICFHVDVFAEQRFAGNQLAVFLGAGKLAASTMQAIALEMNFSETTFILEEEPVGGGFPVRIFTPAEEVPFAGHPTLGTAYVIRHHLLPEPVHKVVLTLKVGNIPVEFKKESSGVEVAWMKQIDPTFGETFDVKDMAEMLQVPATALDDRFPMQEVSTGIPFFIVPMKRLTDVKQARLKREFYDSMIQNTAARAVLFFCPETEKKENHLHVRMFADALGVPEDPATGSANGCLAAYLARYRYFGSEEVDIRVEQGYEIRRPSLLYLRARDLGENIDVFVGGQVHLVARGEVYLD